MIFKLIFLPKRLYFLNEEIEFITDFIVAIFVKKGHQY